jgi:small-conductance mechanosensitive channel
MTTLQIPDIGDRVRVSMYNFLTGTVVDWDGTVTGRASETTLVVTDAEEGNEYVIPIRHVHLHSMPTIAGV